MTEQETILERARIRATKMGAHYLLDRSNAVQRKTPMPTTKKLQSRWKALQRSGN